MKPGRSVLLAVLGLAFAVASPRRAAADCYPTTLGPIALGFDLAALRAHPSIAQQIAAGKNQIRCIEEDDQTLDSNVEAVDYLNGIEAKLLKAYGKPPPFPITIHLSTREVINAVALPGGQIVVYEGVFDQADSEAQLVGIIAHETAHQLHNDFLKLFADYKQGRDVFGAHGVLAQSQAFEAAADKTGMRIMYKAGWDPNEMVVEFTHLRKITGSMAIYSSHPSTPDRIKALKTEAASLPPEPGLIKDSAEFERLKSQI